MNVQSNIKMLLRAAPQDGPFVFAVTTPARTRPLRQLDDHAVAYGHAAIHLRRKIEVVRGNDGGKS